MTKETEYTVCIDTGNVTRKLGMKKDPWYKFTEADAMAFLDRIEEIVHMNPRAERIQLTGVFPIEISLALGALFERYGLHVDYSRPGVSMRSIPYIGSPCPELAL